MRLKSYFAGTVESAICLARQEMGEDAMLVSSRKSLPENRSLGAYEVVFAVSQDPVLEAAARAAAVKQTRMEEAAPSTAQTLALEMAEMRRQIARVSAQVFQSTGRPLQRLGNPALDDLEQALTAQNVDGELTSSVLRNLEALAPNSTAVETRQAFRQELQSRFTVSAKFSPISAGPGPSSARSVVALVGPPGGGKTITLAKLAVTCGLSAQRSTHIVSYDSHRIAPGDQLRAYAAILGVSFEDLVTVGALAQSLKDNARKELILIDTPGYSASDFDLSSDLSQFLSTYPHLDIHLVLSCAVKTSDLSGMVERYKVFHPAKLLFTRLDETGSYGGILNESARTGLPVSFLSTGPGVPDDIEAATADRVADLLLRGRETRAVASA